MRAIFMVGVSASGKSRYVKELIKESNDEAFAVFNRDDLRKTLSGLLMLDYWQLPKDTIAKYENLISDLQYSFIDSCISEGLSMIFDNTHLKVPYIKNYVHYIQGRCDVEMVDVMDSSLKRKKMREYYTMRDATRGQNSVGESVIFNQIDSYRNNIANIRKLFDSLPEPATAIDTRYDENKKDIIVVDIDDTLVYPQERLPHQYWDYHNDQPNTGLIQVINRLSGDIDVYILTARSDKYLDDTIRQITPYFEKEIRFILKPRESRQESYDFKGGILDQLNEKFNILVFIDDNQKNIQRAKSMGVNVLKCV